MSRLTQTFLLVAACLTIGTSAVAGESFIGVIVATTTKSNNDTATPFYVPVNSKITIQCDAAAYVLTDSSTVTTSNGIKVSADEKFPTSTGKTVRVSSGTAANLGAYVSAVAVSGTANCKVWYRSSTE